MEIVAATSAPADRHELPQAALPTAEEFNPESRKTDLADSAQVRLASPRLNPISRDCDRCSIRRCAFCTGRVNACHIVLIGCVWLDRAICV
jgi:hypothetical protein